ncbi:hypothetical protein GPECTOR_52g29 [Gonium pectorale]|uniref:Peptidase M14 domain-containing protein n=1 Tax=Gonium pectorale TaxID=33097 RepID=A0A150G705_GONPE|nr:hypothetical protein GPECTOR_52g29 [Gonium pectorale]|eukprot:KXZ45627.1 hypothetical protein GPECTOR_52g29 [Gonium pectorale]
MLSAAVLATATALNGGANGIAAGGAGLAGGPAAASLPSVSPAKKTKGKGPKAAAAAALAAAAAASGTASELADGDAAPSATHTGIGPGLYCATFTLHFPVPGTYYVASCYPYTYTDMQEHLDSLQRRLAADAAPGSSPSPSACLAPSPPPLVRSLLCYTLSGLRAELLTITDWACPLEALRQRECIFITSRVHPGETCASWIMQGLLEFLLSSEPAAATLRSSFVFKLVPMLNPDGVVNGNYRCSLAGVDLNRVWDRPVRGLYPTVYHSKRLLQQLAAAGRLALYIDIHGHSTKTDTFFYGCEPSAAALQPTTSSAKDRPAPAASAPGCVALGSAGPHPINEPGLAWSTQQPSADGGGVAGAAGPGLAVQGAGVSGNGGAAGGAAGVCRGGPGVFAQPGAASASAVPLTTTGPSPRAAARLRVRMLPYLTARISSDYSFSKCSFKIRKAKLSAARVVVHRELGVAGSYTLESSLGGGSVSGSHFSVRDYLAMGASLGRAICELAEVDDIALLEEMHARVNLPAL